MRPSPVRYRLQHERFRAVLVMRIVFVDDEASALQTMQRALHDRLAHQRHAECAGPLERRMTERVVEATRFRA